MSSTLPRMPSRAMISRMSSRSSGVPWPPPYWSATGPRSRMTFSMAVTMSSWGRAETNGMPPASETTSGRLATAKRARTSEALSPEVLSA